MAHDLLIKNGMLVDGTGAPARRADLAITGGKIAEIGPVTDGATTVIDASDLVVAPGFIDPHTHYDAQICWDGAVTPSSWHGVTSVIMGNCGVGIAPCRPQTREIAMRDLVNVEAIPFDVLNMGITWDWESFPEFLAAAARRRPSLNLGFLAPLTPFRHYVMGEASMERAATPDETVQIKALLGEAIDAGAFGFSTTILNQHVGFQGRPLACRNASRDELRAYANALQERGKGAIEIALTRKIAVMDDEEYELLDFLLRESGRHVTFLALFDRDDIPEAVRDTLRKAAPLIARGARPQTSPLPLTRDINMRNPFSFAAFPSWNRVFVEQVEARPGRRLRRSRLPQSVPRGAEAAHGLRQLGAHPRARGALARLEGARGPVGGGDRPRAGEGRGRRVPRPHPPGRPRRGVHHGLVQHARGSHAGDPERQERAGRSGRRRCPRGHALRRRLPDLSPRHLGARAPGPDLGGRGAPAHL